MSHSAARFARIAALVLASLPVLAPGVRAAQVEDLYQAEVPVATRDAEARDEALAQALRQVVVKVSGQRGADTHPAIQASSAAPGRFVQQYQYRSLLPATGDAGQVPSLRLKARFDPGLVDTLVRDAGLPVWGHTRPALALWGVVSRQGRRELMRTDLDPGLADAVRAGARARGVPLIVPLLDLEDQARIVPDEVWGGFYDGVRAASRRYEAEGSLLVRAEQVLPSLWEARWTLLLSDGADEWNTRGDVFELALEAGVNVAADRLAARFANLAVMQASSRVRLVVGGVITLGGYARAIEYLEGLEGVTRVDVLSAEGDALGLELTANGGPAALRQLIALGNVLGEDTRLRTGEGLAYQLLP